MSIIQKQTGEVNMFEQKFWEFKQLFLKHLWELFDPGE